jgi:hypothetical protein
MVGYNALGPTVTESTGGDMIGPAMSGVGKVLAAMDLGVEIAGMAGARVDLPLTPDGRYMVVRGRLWRVANPAVDPGVRDALVRELMAARREVKAARRSGDEARLAAARSAVDAAKVALGERGPVWWQDGAGDFNRHLARNTPYRDWYERIRQQGKPT